MAQLTNCTSSCSPTSFIVSINTDRLPLLPHPHFSTLIQNYVSTIATIERRKEGSPEPCSNAAFKTILSKRNISSQWRIGLEHDLWNETFVCNNRNNSRNSVNQIMDGIRQCGNKVNTKCNTSGLYAIVWTSSDDDHENDDNYDEQTIDEDEYDDHHESKNYFDEDEDRSDLDAKEILWTLL